MARKKLDLDYTYGETVTPSPAPAVSPAGLNGTDDSLAAAAAAAPVISSTPDSLSGLDDAGWSRLVGYTCVRLVAPCLLLLHALLVVLALWAAQWDITAVAGADTGSGAAVPLIAGALGANLLLVHGVARVLFARSYWKKTAG
jgi:hypothetical protein